MAPSRSRHRIAVPGAMVRLARDWLRLTAVILLCVAMLLVTGLQAGARVTLQSTLDENWRGAYDLFVTVPPAGGGEPAMLPPNALGPSPGRAMAFAQLEQIRALPGVEVAAPIGQIAIPMHGGSGLDFAVPVAQGVTTPQPKAYQATVRLLTDDGLGPRLVQAYQVAVLLDDADLPAKRVVPASEMPDSIFCVIDDHEWAANDPASPELCRTVRRAFAQVRWLDRPDDVARLGDIFGGYVVFAVVTPPQVTSALTLVDPIAEAALLGDAGAFLKPLAEQSATVDIDTLEAWAGSASGPRTDELRASIVDVREGQAARRAQLEELGLPPYDGPALPMLPVIVSARPEIPLTVEVSVEGFGPTTIDARDGVFSRIVVPESLRPGVSGTPLGSVSLDLSAILDPFTVTQLVAPWPGATPTGPLPVHPPQPSPFPLVTAAVSIGSAQTEITGEATAVMHGTAFAHQSSLLPEDDGTPPPLPITDKGNQVGVESVYATLAANVSPPPRSDTEETGLRLAAIGEFDPAVVTPLSTGLSAVPLGGYDPPGSTLVADAAGNPINPVDLRPSVSGLGLVNQATTMIGSFSAARSLLGDRPISAVRVRVAGISGYSPSSIEKVLGVKTAIEALGLRAIMVAGSSPTPVRVMVEDYAFGTLDPAVPQRVGTLGVVEQRGSELGAAVRVDTTVARATTLALVVGLAATALLLGVAQIVAVPRRRREAAILSMMGWRRRRIARWYAAEEVASIIAVVAVGATAVLIARDRALTGIGAGVALTLVLLLGTVTVVASVWRSRTRATTGRAVRSRSTATGRLRGLSLGAFGARQVLLHPSFGLSVLLTTATVGLATTVLHGLLLAERDNAGDSLLATAVADRLLLSRLGLAAVAVGAGIALAVLTRRLDLRIRAAHAQILRAMGWTGKSRQRARAVEAATVLVPAVLLTATACWFVAASLRPGDAHWPAIVGTAAALVTGGLTLLSTSKDETP